MLKSGFLPGAIGHLLALDALAYLVHGFTDVLAPASAAHLVPWIQLPAPAAEGALSLWLLLFGVTTARWTPAGAAPPARSASVMP